MLKPLSTIVLLLLAIAGLTWLPISLVKAVSSTLLINAIYDDTYLSGEPDEAIRLINVSAAPIALSGYTLTDFEAIITLTGVISPGQSIWIARLFLANRKLTVWPSNLGSNPIMNIRLIPMPPCRIWLALAPWLWPIAVTRWFYMIQQRPCRPACNLRSW